MRMWSPAAARGSTPGVEIVEDVAAYRGLDHQNGMAFALIAGYRHAQRSGGNAQPHQVGARGQGVIFAIAAADIYLPRLMALEVVHKSSL